MVKLYGIKNCDKVRAARKWLDLHGIDFEFQDIRETPIDEVLWRKWLNYWGIDHLINKRSLNWKQLSENQKNNLTIDKAELLLKNNPTLMKRPHLIIDRNPRFLGFSDSDYQKIFSVNS